MKIFFSANSTSVVVMILYLWANFLYKRLRVSSVKAIVGTMITTLFGFVIEIKASITKLLPKLVGALTAIFSPLTSRFNKDDCSLCKVDCLPPMSTLNISYTNLSSQFAVSAFKYGYNPVSRIRWFTNGEYSISFLSW